MKIPPANSTLINVCIIPNETVSNECIQLSQSLKSEGTMFVLDGKTKFAHMTVYMARFANNEINNVISSVSKSLENAKSFECKHIGYFMTKGRYFEVSYQKSKEFMHLHEKIIKNAKDLRINPHNPFEEGYFTPYTIEQQENAKETGYDLAHNLYRPHITLTRYKENMIPEKQPELKLTDLSFILHKICVYKANDDGTVYEKLSEFEIN